MDKIAYLVTESAGPKVAGRRVQPGDELLLTEFEARAELLAGSLKAKAAEAAAAADAPVDEAAERPSKKRS